MCPADGAAGPGQETANRSCPLLGISTQADWTHWGGRDGSYRFFPMRLTAMSPGPPIGFTISLVVRTGRFWDDALVPALTKAICLGEREKPPLAGAASQKDLGFQPNDDLSTNPPPVLRAAARASYSLGSRV